MKQGWSHQHTKGQQRKTEESKSEGEVKRECTQRNFIEVSRKKMCLHWMPLECSGFLPTQDESELCDRSLTSFSISCRILTVGDHCLCGPKMLYRAGNKLRPYQWLVIEWELRATKCSQVKQWGTDWIYGEYQSQLGGGGNIRTIPGRLMLLGIGGLSLLDQTAKRERQ